MKFDISTRLLILFCPTDLKYSANHLGDGPTVRFVIVPAIYLVHPPFLSKTTLTISFPLDVALAISIGVLIFNPDMAAISLAIPR